MTHILSELVLVFGVALTAAYFARKAGAPSMVGFMLAGVLLGAGGFGLIEDRHDIEILAEIGVVLLLFGIGLKISLRELWQLKRYVAVGGGLQVVLTAAAAAALSAWAGRAWPSAVALGYVIALSSTAVLLALLERRGEGDTPHGRLMLGMLLAQDLAVVPIFFSMPFLAGGLGEDGLAEIPWVVGETVVVLVGLVLAARVLFPWLANRAVASRSPELVTLVTAVTVFGTALFGMAVGLSPALGAFLAGVAISSSPYSQHIVSEIAPFRFLFESLFFVSIGLLARPAIWLEQPAHVLQMFGLILILKTLIAGLLAWWLLRNLARALTVGAGLAHIGEFSFVVAREAGGAGLLSGADVEMITSAAVPTMVLTPLFLAVGGRWIAGRHASTPGLQAANGNAGANELQCSAGDPRCNHAILVGYGIGGRKVSSILAGRNVPLTVVELNRETLREVARGGMDTLYGDAARAAVLKAAGLAKARALVVTVPDPSGARAIVATARGLNPNVTIVVRTRYALRVDELYHLGADEVVVEEYESALELAGRVLGCFGASPEEVDREKDALRRRATP